MGEMEREKEEEEEEDNITISSLNSKRSHDISLGQRGKKES